LRGQVNNYQRDGPATVDGNKGAAVNYEPNTLGGPIEDPSKAPKQFQISGLAQRNVHVNMGDIDFE
jgi:catalase